MSEPYEICTDCGEKCYPEDISAWIDFETVPLICKCGAIYWVKINREPIKALVVLGEIMPTLPLGTDIVIENHEHSLHGKNGQIVGKKPSFYRVLVDKKKIWIPTHWIKPND